MHRTYYYYYYYRHSLCTTKYQYHASITHTVSAYVYIFVASLCVHTFQQVYAHVYPHFQTACTTT
jgi:hypothetical protein